MPNEHAAPLYDAIRDVRDFPAKGVVFKDITPLLLRPKLLELAVDLLAEPVIGLGIDRVLGIESRGFIFGAPLAMRLGAGLVLARKAGKLPWKTRRVEYSLEYGTDVLEVHTDGIEAGHRVLVVDDLLATGGTAKAAAQVVSDAGAVLVGFSFLIELSFLKGRDGLPDAPVFSLLKYSEE
jgi:adenine phosphoribosyltransferase